MFTLRLETYVWFQGHIFCQTHGEIAMIPYRVGS